MRLLLAANNQATRRNEIIKSYLQLGSSSNRYAPRLPQQETKSSTKQLPPTGPILGPENILKTGFAQKGLPSTYMGRIWRQQVPSPSWWRNLLQVLVRELNTSSSSAKRCDSCRCNSSLFSDVGPLETSRRTRQNRNRQQSAASGC